MMELSVPLKTKIGYHTCPKCGNEVKIPMVVTDLPNYGCPFCGHGVLGVCSKVREE